MEDVIKHFSHQHPLRLIAIQEVEEKSKYYKCYGCGFSYSSSKMYGCSEEECFGSSVYLCTLCAHLPELIYNHPLHPQHDHTLQLVNQSPHNYSINWCDACGGKLPTGDECLLFYHCDECTFDLHAHCDLSLRPTLRHAAHHHLLTLVHTNYTRFHKSWDCKTCESRLLDGVVFVRCVECDFNFHINCFRSADVDGHASLPDATTKHLMQCHPHPLTLVTDDDESLSTRVHKYFFCDACKKWNWPQHWVYKCLECNNFMSHLYCPIQFPSHSDTVSLYTHLSSGIDNPQCQGCKKPILEGRLACACKDHCKLFLHDSCFQYWKSLHKQIHPMHPHHPLKLMFNHTKPLTCTCCGRECNGFMFKCQGCKFFLHLECTLLVPSLQHQDHKDHLLLLFDRRATNPYRTVYLRCVECRENFSLTKCLLPYIIQHKCHFHPLTLLPRLVENDDINQCYCDACEDKRDPDECIYYCGECKFEVDISCVKQEVSYVSHNYKLKGIKFVTPQQITEEEEARKNKIDGQHVILLKEVLLPLNQVEEEEIKNVLKLASNMTWESTLGELPSYDEKTSTKILFTDEPFKLFVNKINSIFTLKATHEMVLSCLEVKHEVIRVGEYLVPLNFKHVLEALFSKHGDFGAECTLSPKIKQYIFFGFCKVLQSIWSTKLAYVTETFLTEWWIFFVLGKAAGFKIQFAFENLKRIAYAHFGRLADKYADRKLTKVRTKIRELPHKIKELERELHKNKEKLEKAIIKEKELREASFRVKKSHLMRKCLMEMEDLECYTGGELFFPPLME